MRISLEKFKAAYLKAYSANPLQVLFVTIVGVALILCLWLNLLSEGKILGWAFFNDHSDTFMDHFNSVVYSSDHPYTKYEVIYPPLITLFYAFVGYLTIPLSEEIVGQTLAVSLRNSQASLLLFFFISFVSLYLLHIFVNRMIRQRYGRILTECTYLAILLSYPLLFGFERGNSIILAFLFCMAFVLGYDSENKWIRYGSYIALGCATGVKIFPALLAILILRKKEWKEFLICFVVVTALLLAPFVFTDGNIGMLLTTIMSYSSTVAASNGVLNFSDISSYLGLPGIAGTAVSLGVTALCIITVLFRKNVPLWKLLGLLCCVLALCFSIGSEYLLVYMIIPLLFFLRDEHEPTGLNHFYVILLAVIFMLMPAFGPTDYRIIGTIKATAALVFMITLYADSFGLIGMKHRRSDDGQV